VLKFTLESVEIPPPVKRNMELANADLNILKTFSIEESRIPTEIPPTSQEEHPILVVSAKPAEETPLLQEEALEVLEEQEPIPTTFSAKLPEYVGFESYEMNLSKHHYPIPQRIDISHIAGNEGHHSCLYSYASNYTTIAFLLAPDYEECSFLPLIDLELDRFDTDVYATSVGLNVRYVPGSNGKIDEIWGMNCYYDWRQGTIGYFNQVSVGVEILSRRWEFHANAYIPFGAKNHEFIRTCDDYEDGYFLTHFETESVSFSFDSELGVYLFDSDPFNIYLGAGPYYLSGRMNQSNTIGGIARLRQQIYDYLTVDLYYSWDPFFQSVYQGEVTFSIPLYRLNNDDSLFRTRQIYERTHRNRVMPVSKRSTWDYNW
jgi:hypothetical protein